MDNEQLLTSDQVAKFFRVHRKSVVRWAEQGYIGYIRTLGGQYRFRQSEVLALLKKLEQSRGSKA